MNYQRVPSWDLEDVNTNDHVDDIFNLDYEVAEITWENGQLTLHELGSRRVPTKPQPTTTTITTTTTSWDPPRTAETLEALVNQATHTHQPYPKTNVAAVIPTLNLNESDSMTSDALVPSADNTAQQRPIKRYSTRVCSCSDKYPSAFIDARGGGEAHHCRDMSVSQETFVAPDHDIASGDLGRRRRLTSADSPENTSSGRDYVSVDNSARHRRTQRETKAKKENKNKTPQAKCSTLIKKRRRTAAVHNQSERQRREKINQKMKTLQNMVPNSSKTDKSSMLDEVIEHIKQLQSQVNGANTMSMSPMMMSLVMQQQHLQLQHKCLMNSMGMGMNMNPNPNGPYNIPPSFHPSAFMHTPPYWNNLMTTNQIINPNTMAGGPMPASYPPGCQPPNMDSYSKMAVLYQQMQNQSGGPFPKK